MTGCASSTLFKWGPLLLALIFSAPLLSHAAQPIVFAVAAQVKSFDPRYATDAESVRVNQLLYQSLVGFDPSLRPVPQLASWQVISPVHYRFTLSPAYFEGLGRAVRAEDVKATYDSVLNPQTASPYRASLAVIDRIEAIDAQVVDFHLKHPDGLLPSYLSVGIMPADLLEQGHRFGQQPEGSGPWRLDSLEEGRWCVTRKNDAQQVCFLLSKDPTVRLLQLMKGEVDLAQNNFPPELIRAARERTHLKVEQQPGSNFSYLGFNLADPVTGHPGVREAMSYAIDRQSIIRYLFAQGAQTAESILTPDHWAGHPQLQANPFDPEKARQLLLASGLKLPIQLSYKTSTDPFALRLASVLAYQLKQVGIEVKIQSYDWGTYYADIKAGRFQLYGLSWVGIKTPDIFEYVFASTSFPPQGANRGRYTNSKVDAWIEQAKQVERLEEKAHFYRLIAQTIHEDRVYIPLWYEDQTLIRQARIQGYRLRPDGGYQGLNEVTQR